MALSKKELIEKLKTKVYWSCLDIKSMSKDLADAILCELSLEDAFEINPTDLKYYGFTYTPKTGETWDATKCPAVERWLITRFELELEDLQRRLEGMESNAPVEEIHDKTIQTFLTQNAGNFKFFRGKSGFVYIFSIRD